MKALADHLTTCTADVVLLQEVWVDADAQLLMSSARTAGLVHAVHFRSGLFGSGLVTLSRHPLRRVGFWRYAAGGSTLALHQGDAIAGKGIGWVRLDVPPLGEVDVINTHTASNYSHQLKVPPRGMEEAWAGTCVPADEGGATRLAQMLQLAQMVDIITAGSSRPMVLGGDLNSKPGSLEMDLLRSCCPQLRDAWVTGQRAAPSGGGGGGGAGGVGDAEEEGYTHNSPGNSFIHRRQVPERIDYVLTSLGVGNVQLALTQPEAGGASYSDHFGVAAQLRPLPPPGVPRAVGGAAGAAVASDDPGVAAVQSPARAAAVLLGSAAVLEEGIADTQGDAVTKIILGGMGLLTLAYSGAGLPLVAPDVALRGWQLGALLLAAVLGGALMLALLLTGLLGDRAQARALQGAYRQLRVLMEGRPDLALAAAAGPRGSSRPVEQLEAMRDE